MSANTNGDSQYCAGCNDAAKIIEKQSAALKLARVALEKIGDASQGEGSHQYWALEALAAIDGLKGE